MILIATLLIVALASAACDDSKTTVNSDQTSGVDDATAMSDATSSLDLDSSMGGSQTSMDLGSADMGQVDAGIIVTQPRFNPRGADFYDTPWPSDARLTDKGTPDLSVLSDLSFTFLRS